MTHQHDLQTPFDPQAYREAMGPGYGIALFREQAELTGQSLTAKRSLPPMNNRQRWLASLRHGLLLRLDHLLERSRTITQAKLSNLEEARTAPNCC